MKIHFIIRTNRLILDREIISVCCGDHTIRINIMWGKCIDFVEAETLVYIMLSTGLKTFLVHLLLYLTHLLPLKKTFFFYIFYLSGSDDVHNKHLLRS